MSKTTTAPAKLACDRQASYIELAKLKGRELEPHEGYPRTNDGGWIVTDADSGRQVLIVSFRGQAKRGQAWNAPDPEGQAIALEIVRMWNAKRKCPECVNRALDDFGCCEECGYEDPKGGPDSI